MAVRTEPLSLPADPLARVGWGLAALAGLAVLAPLAALAAGGLARLGPADLAALRFTVTQALLSAALSCALAVPLARALARRRFFGRGLLVTLLGAPFLLPTLVAILGLLAIFGRSGWLNAALASAGLPMLSIYGFGGVILAHVFFNLPLATRLLLQGWQAIPSERMRLAASLGFSPADTARHLERPMLRAVLPGAFTAIFLICLTSFAVALTLGGGPRATTVELAIYQSLRMSFDLPRATTLALVQLGLTASAALLAARLTLPSAMGAGLGRAIDLFPPQGWHRWADGLAIGLGALFLLAPLAAVMSAGLPYLASLPSSLGPALLRSVSVALISTALTLTLALPIAEAATRPRGRWAELAGTLALAASPLVLGTGLFLLVRPNIAPAQLALPATVAVNALLSLPFALRILLPETRALHRDFGRLAASLSLTGFARLRLLALPRLRRPLGFAAGVAAALSMGDLGVIALFADERSETLPLLVFRLMGAYRTDQAAAAALVLMAASFALFALFDRIGRHA